MKEKVLDYEKLTALRKASWLTDSYCGPISLQEAAHILKGTPVPTFPDLKKTVTHLGVRGERNGSMSLECFLEDFHAYTGYLGLVIIKILARESFIKKFTIPTVLENRLEITNSKKVVVPTPAVVIMARPEDGSCHAETLYENEYFTKRLQFAQKNNYHIGMSITLTTSAL